MDILRLIEDLEDMVVERPRWFGRLAVMPRREDVQMQIAKIRASIPMEVKQAVNLTRESERVVEQAREDAAKTIEGAKNEGQRLIDEAKTEIERMMAAAKLEQDRMLGENEVLKIAKAQADEIRASADAEARQMRRGAEDYAYSVLNKLEVVAGKVMTSIDQGKESIRPDSDLAIVQPRERVKA